MSIATNNITDVNQANRIDTDPTNVIKRYDFNQIADANKAFNTYAMDAIDKGKTKNSKLLATGVILALSILLLFGSTLVAGTAATAILVTGVVGIIAAAGTAIAAVNADNKIEAIEEDIRDKITDVAKARYTMLKDEVLEDNTTLKHEFGNYRTSSTKRSNNLNTNIDYFTERLKMGNLTDIVNSKASMLKVINELEADKDLSKKLMSLNDLYRAMGNQNNLA